MVAGKHIEEYEVVHAKRDKKERIIRYLTAQVAGHYTQDIVFLTLAYSTY